MALAQNALEPQVKSAIILRLFGYIEWPESETATSYRLGIFKGGDPISQTLLERGNNHREKGRPISISLESDISELQNFHLVYIPQAYIAELPAIALQTRRTGTLLVTNGATDPQNQMINFLIGRPKVAFEVNRTNIVYEYLTMDRTVLELGGTELDIAELYKGMETELDTLKRGLEGARRQFEEQQTENKKLRDISTQAEKDIQSLRQETLRLENKVNDQSKGLAQAQAAANTLKRQVSAGQQELTLLQQELNQSKSRLLNEAKELISLQDKLRSREREYVQQETTIAANQRLIEDQQRAINKQNLDLQAQGTVISSQKNWLILAGLAILIISGLFIRILQISRKIQLLNTKLSEAKDSLEEKVKARTAQLQLATDHAIQASQAKSEFLSNMSHELRTPLNAIIGFSTMMKDEVYGKVGDEKYKEYTQLILKSGDHLLAIIDEILDLTMIENGKTPFKESPFVPDGAITECIDIIKPTLKIKEQTITYTHDHAIEFLNADRNLFCQMLLNLLGNASKFSGEKTEIVVSTCMTTHGEFQLHIQDSGIGIEPDKIEKIIRPFYQVESASSRSFHGVGLGLSLVTQMIELHDGTIAIESELGVGTLVSLTFPAERSLVEQ